MLTISSVRLAVSRVRWVVKRTNCKVLYLIDILYILAIISYWHVHTQLTAFVLEVDCFYHITRQRKNLIASTWREKMLGYFFADIIPSKKWTVFRERSSGKTVSEHIFSKRKIYLATRAVSKNWGIFWDIFPRFNWAIFSHVTSLDQSRASENNWWIINALISKKQPPSPSSIVIRYNQFLRLAAVGYCSVANNYFRYELWETNARRLGKRYERKLSHFRLGPVLLAALLLSFIENKVQLCSLLTFLIKLKHYLKKGYLKLY